jgi:hypothetical protein
MERGHELVEISPGATLPLLLKHHVEVGCEIDEALVTLAQLARNVPAACFRYGGYESLKEAGDILLENALGKTVGWAERLGKTECFEPREITTSESIPRSEHGKRRHEI